MKYSDLLGCLTSALAYCEELGLGDRVNESRFTEYKARIESICSMIEHGPLESLSPEIKQELKDRHLEYILSLTESLEFAGTIDFFKTCDAKIARQKLAKILAGPVMPKDEGENSNEPRNTLFEVNLASKAWRAGLKPSLGKLADIEVEIAGKPLFIECKRPLSENGIRTGLKRARKQIDHWVKHKAPGPRGVIAVSVTKSLNPGDKILPYREVAAAKESLSNLLEQLAEANKETLHNLGTNIIGVMFHVITPSIGPKQYSNGEYFNLCHLARPGSTRYSAFQELGDRLSKLDH